MSIMELLYKHSALFFEQNRPCFRAFQNSIIEEILGIIGQGLVLIERFFIIILTFTSTRVINRVLIESWKLCGEKSTLMTFVGSLFKEMLSTFA